MLYQSESGDLTLALTGDAMVSRRLSLYQEPAYLELVKLLQGADAAFCNMEMPVHDYDLPPNFTSGTHMTSDPRAAEDLRWMGINLASTANNHIYDYGDGSVYSTQRKLAEAGIACAGTGRNLSEARSPAYLDTRNGRVALLAATSYYPEWGKAGEQRPDFQGRPGLSFLRHEVIHTVDEAVFRELKRASENLGLEMMKGHRSAFGAFAGQYASREDEFRFVTSFKVSPYDFEDVKFVLGNGFKTTTRPYAGDVEDILRWVRDARRQADWVVFSLHGHEGAYPVMPETRPVGLQGLRDVPADFVRQFARTCIEEGVDVFVGHGPHLLRGIEIYKGKPIFYSLGEFVFQIETVRWLPATDYEQYGLKPTATPADFFDARSGKDTRSFAAESIFWRSAIALCRFSGGALDRIELHPVDLGRGRPRAQRGRPMLAREPVASEVVKQLKELSRPYGTDIVKEQGTWVIRPKKRRD
ncbi:MAG: CapA family protein [Chloroflexi bacterium]|nr:CapA family protein [Chloroflexota bacterium]